MWLCVMRKLRSTWVPAQSDQVLRGLHLKSVVTYLSTERKGRLLSELVGAQVDLLISFANTPFVGYAL